MLEVYKPHSNREAVGVWLCSSAKRRTYRVNVPKPLVVGYSTLIPSERLAFDIKS